MPKYPQPIQQCVAFFKKLPGVGNRTAERYACQLLQWAPAEAEAFSALLRHVHERIQPCPECRCWMDQGACPFCCSRVARDRSKLCILASAKDVYAIEETGAYKGLYHVLGTLLSPILGKLPGELQVEGLKKRILALQVQEIIIALDATVEGDATALYLKEFFQPMGIQTSRLAFGLPLGSSFDYVDGGTLAHALHSRHQF